MSKIKDYEQKLKDNVTLTEMHLPEGKNIWTCHQIRKQKTSFYLTSYDTMNSQPISVDSDLIKYRSKICPYHGLHRSFLTTKTPDIKVKDEFKDNYTIRFCSDLFINMIKEARLDFNGTELQFMNTVSLKLNKDPSPQTLNNPTSHLIPTSIFYYPPWSYSRGKSMYFPLQVCGDLDNLDHNINYNLDLSNLIIMEKDGEIISYDKSKLEIVGNVDKISVPRMIGIYTTLTRAECSHNICLGSDDAPADYFVKNIYYIEKEEDLGKKIDIRFDSKKTDPVSQIDWGVINMTQTNINKDITFTYSDNLTPVKTSTLVSSVDTIFRNLDSFITEVALRPMCKMRQPGINTWKNSVIIQEDDRKFSPSLTFDGGELVFSLNYENSEDKFVGFCIMHRMTRFRFTSYPKTEEERKKSGSTIEEIR